ncbi:MAG: theronine dehydrogenase [Micrococcaceae bacterium]|nr:theronine dehydrogenase [Micrococcaceae bacterium]
MQALTIVPGQQGSLQVREMPEPEPGEGSVLVQSLAVGLCGTDAEIIAAEYGQSPEGESFLVLGHENLGRVLNAPQDSGLVAGDLVVCIVRRPDPEPCAACAAGEWDMCRNGNYTEHGIKGLHGFARERWRAEPDELVPLGEGLAEVGVLLEPTTIVAKAWEQIDRIGSRAFYQPNLVAITGAGPVGLLAALLARQRGLEVHVFDQVTDGPKPDLVRSLGATYHAESLADSGLKPDIVVECTGVPAVVLQAIGCTGTDSITCLTGVSGAGEMLRVDVGGLNRDAVLENSVIFGTVNANRRHYQAAVDALQKADQDWLGRLITRRVPLQEFEDALKRRPDDVKVVLTLPEA